MVTFICKFCCKRNEKVPRQDGTSFRGPQGPRNLAPAGLSGGGHFCASFVVKATKKSGDRTKPAQIPQIVMENWELGGDCGLGCADFGLGLPGCTLEVEKVARWLSGFLDWVLAVFY